MTPVLQQVEIQLAATQCLIQLYAGAIKTAEAGGFVNPAFYADMETNLAEQERKLNELKSVTH